MTETQRQLAARDRVMRAVARRTTPAERLARMEALQNAAWDILNTSPQAFERFWRRNLRERAARAALPHAAEAAI